VDGREKGKKTIIGKDFNAKTEERGIWGKEEDGNEGGERKLIDKIANREEKKAGKINKNNRRERLGNFK